MEHGIVLRKPKAPYLITRTCKKER